MPEPNEPIPAFASTLDRVRLQSRAERALRMSQGGANPSHPILDMVAQQLLERLQDIKKRPNQVWIRGFWGQKWAESLHKLEIRPVFGPLCPPNTVDMVIDFLTDDFYSDAETPFLQQKMALRPDGIYLGALFGEDTLWELRRCLIMAEQDLYGGASPRVHPHISLGGAARLLEQAHFRDIVVDRDRVATLYPDLHSLMHDLRRMGQTNALAARTRRPVSRRFFAHTQSLYAHHHAQQDGSIPASFVIVYLHGVAADQALRR